MDINPNMVDVLVAQDESTLTNRLNTLEKKIQLQADEIVCLKSALADAIRRLQSVEHHQTNTQSSALLTVKQPQPRLTSSSSYTSQATKPAPKPKSPTPKPAPNSNSTDSNNATTKQTVQKSTSKNPVSSSNSASTISLSKSTATTRRLSNGDITETGLIKLYLRGRPINFYLPKSLAATYDPNNVLKCPSDISLKLEWVYGYRGKDCRSNLYQLQTGECVYFVAAVAVLFNSEERTQRHYLGHTDDIKSLALHPDKIRVATGQCTGHDKHEGKAHVRIWDSVSLATLKIIGLNSDVFQNNICCLSFSRTDNGQHLAVVDEAGERNLSVWLWESQTKQASTKCYGDSVFCLEWHPTEANILITAGKQHLITWNVDAVTGMLTRRVGTFEGVVSEKPKYVLTLGFGGTTQTLGDLISGDSEGNILVWSIKDGKAVRLISNAHDGGVFTMLVIDNKVVTGGKDSRLIEWDSEWQRTGRTLQLPDPQIHGWCRCIAQDQGNFLLVGTTKNSIFKVNFELDYIECLVQGHSDELWGLSPSNTKVGTSFLTCGNDSRLCQWDTLSHTIQHSQHFEDKLHCLHVHPSYENLVAIGCYSGKPKWVVFDFNERKVVFSQVETGQESIECIQYSPNGLLLAVGSRDNFIYIYQVSENGLKYSRIGKCSGHSSFISKIDWSTDSEYLMSNSGDYETLYWHVANNACKQIMLSQVIRDIEWQASGGCILSPTSMGIWGSTSMDGTDVNATATSKQRGLLAYVDDFGKVNLLTYPCVSMKAERLSYGGHSSHVTNVAFVNNDSRLVTTGGNDMSIFQWRIDIF